MTCYTRHMCTDFLQHVLSVVELEYSDKETIIIHLNNINEVFDMINICTKVEIMGARIEKHIIIHSIMFQKYGTQRHTMPSVL